MDEDICNVKLTIQFCTETIVDIATIFVSCFVPVNNNSSSNNNNNNNYYY